jgi:hypothetical protein
MNPCNILLGDTIGEKDNKILLERYKNIKYKIIKSKILQDKFRKYNIYQKATSEIDKILL